MKVGRSASWYRPYFVPVNNKEYRVEKIHFYKDNSILASTYSGWLEDVHGKDIESFELPVEEVKLKRKEKFDGSAFVITHKEGFGNDIIVDLYIPAEMFNIQFVDYELRNHSFYAIYEGEQDIYISRFIKSLDGKLREIRNEYEEVYERVSAFRLYVCKAEEMLNDINKLKELAEKYIAEKKRLSNLTVDDIDKE